MYVAVKFYIGVCMQRAGHEDKIKGVPGFESWGFRDNQHDKWNVCRLGSMYPSMDVDGVKPESIEL